MSTTRSWTDAGVEPATLRFSRAALVALGALFLCLRTAGIEVSLATQAAVYLVGMVALNLPHGGYEHVANLRRRARGFRWRYVGGYLALAGAFVGLFLAAPVAGLALAVAVAVLKGGGGDLHVLDATTGTSHLRSRARRLLAVAARGGAVMAVPLVAWPATFRAFGGLMVGLVDPAGLTGVPVGAVRPLVGGLYGSAAVAHLGWGFANRTGDGAWVADAAETLLLIAYFAAVPVLVAVGLYFPFWYSARQVARERAIEEPDPGVTDRRTGDSSAGTPTGPAGMRAWGAFVGGAAATAAVAAAFWWLVPRPLAGAAFRYGAVAFWSVFISVVALPHVVVGSVLDRRRGIWHVP